MGDGRQHADEPLEGIDVIDGEQDESFPAENDFVLDHGATDQVWIDAVDVEDLAGVLLAGVRRHGRHPVLPVAKFAAGLADNLGHDDLCCPGQVPCRHHRAALVGDNQGHIELPLCQLAGDIANRWKHGDARALHIPVKRAQLGAAAPRITFPPRNISGLDFGGSTEPVDRRRCGIL